eukprot:TRINITY_DN106918_c0_g1_i1.p1 TRINITY_DN106918_c0_g1~~TRINITY_DN106918_c0_g1_i1.p1  ORF type:complete len:181 (+),score=25.54 TRINITY_DN106918_c0_g1_i1:54-596(+)
MGTTLPFNKSSIVGDGSGRDTYVMMDAMSVHGTVQRSTAPWIPTLRGPQTATLLPHYKGYDSWYTQAHRPGHWSPPAPRRRQLYRSSSLPVASKKESAADRSLGRMLQRHHRMPKKIVKAKGSDSDSAAESATSPRFPWQPAEGQPGEGMLQGILQNYRSASRLQRSTCPDGFSFARTER